MRSKLSAVALMLLPLCLAAPARAFVNGSTRVTRADTQDGKSRLIVPMQSGAFVVIRTESTQPSPGDAASTLVESEERANLIRRVFVDSKNELFFGYELVVERVAATRQFRVTVRPLSDEYLAQLRARRVFQNRQLHPSYNAAAFSTAPQLIGDGDTFAIDVLQSARTGAKIVDVITVSLDDPSQQEPVTARPPRDFKVEDVQLKVTNYKLKVNGETVHRNTGGCAGALVWFAVGGRGRFVLSLVPHPGHDFRKVGSVRHNTISFEWDGDRYEWESGLPVVGTGGNWNVWVLHDPDYKLDLFDRPASAAAPQPAPSQYDEAVRSMKRRRTQAELGAPSAPEQTPPPPQSGAARRARVVIGSADGVEYLFPKQ